MLPKAEHPVSASTPLDVFFPDLRSSSPANSSIAVASASADLIQGTYFFPAFSRLASCLAVLQFGWGLLRCDRMRNSCSFGSFVSLLVVYFLRELFFCVKCLTMYVWNWVFLGLDWWRSGISGGLAVGIIAGVRFWAMFGPGSFEWKMYSGGSGLCRFWKKVHFLIFGKGSFFF